MSSTTVLSLVNANEVTPFSVITGDGEIQMSIKDIQRWVAPQAPHHEALKFLMICRAQGLNPLVGEAHLVNNGGSWTTIVDKSGWLRKAQSHPAYDGHEAGLICRPWNPATKMFTGPAVEVPGAFLPSDHLLVGAWAKIHRKDRKCPTFASVNASEYNKGQSTWRSIPCTMLRKVALVQALRESGLTSAGWYTAEEVQAPEPYSPQSETQQQHTLQAAVTPAIEAEYAVIEDATCPPDLLAEIDRLREQLGFPSDHPAWLDVLARQGVRSVAEMTPQAATMFRHKLASLANYADPEVLPNFTRPNRAEVTPPTLVSQ